MCSRISAVERSITARACVEEDATMMRTKELSKLAERFNMKFITIKDLQNYRKDNTI
ncbi:bifunctional 3,4-dihydroxy-2-butanone 4-phosphate synthase/GTP cyclohydrolase II protein [Anaerostipes hadrus]|uniref:Bifunctional 3,4-dihydroxy-2-butanone 4-phosphate synthase/GTP cyclohydrolase II protein n=1 Tax=Anaerostipes hadrus TaxID=649756 RepID=A0A6N2VHY8_ANAHA